MQTIVECTDLGVDLLLIQSVRDLTLQTVVQLEHQLILDVTGNLFLLDCFQLLTHIGTECFYGIEIADILYELIVELRQLLALYLVDVYLKGSWLACQFFCMVIFRESNVYFYVIAGLMTDQLLLEARDEHLGTQSQAVILCLTTLKWLTIQEALKVHYNDVIVLSATIYGNHSGITIQQFLYLSVYIFLCYFNGLWSNLQTLVVLNVYNRHSSNSCLKGQTVLLAYLNNLKVDFVLNYIQLCLCNCSIQRLRINLFDCILEEYVLAVVLLDECSWGLALTETRQCNLILCLLVSLLNTLVKFLCVNRYFQLVTVCFYIITRNQFHFRHSCLI